MAPSCVFQFYNGDHAGFFVQHLHEAKAETAFGLASFFFGNRCLTSFWDFAWSNPLCFCHEFDFSTCVGCRSYVSQRFRGCSHLVMSCMFQAAQVVEAVEEENLIAELFDEVDELAVEDESARLKTILLMKTNK